MVYEKLLGGTSLFDSWLIEGCEYSLYWIGFGLGENELEIAGRFTVDLVGIRLTVDRGVGFVLGLEAGLFDLDKVDFSYVW